MNELINSLNGPSALPAIVRAAMAHLNLVMIHPFSDGNGRMGRAVQTMVLSREGILDPRFSSIEEYLGHNTSDYYEILAKTGQGAWHPHNDALPWAKFCLTAHYRQAETILRRLKEIERVWNKLVEELKNYRLNERMLLALLDASLGVRIRNASYRNLAEISDEVAGKDLRALVKHGLLIPQGERRGRIYIASDWLKETRDSVRERKTVTDPFTNIVVDSRTNSNQLSFRGFGS